MYTLIDGKAVSNKIKDGIKDKVDDYRQRLGKVPGLAVIMVGDNPASKVYVNSKINTCKQVGFHSVTETLPSCVSTENLLSLIDKYNYDDSINGILVQLPLPEHIDEREILYSILPEKDVDGFHPINVGKINIGDEAMRPCTPAGIMVLLEEYDIPLQGADVTIVGWGNIVGRPLATLLSKANATVTVCNIFTKDLAAHTIYSDIVISAAGVPSLITAEHVKDGAVVIDVGINRLESGKLVGDVDFENVSAKASHITPVPGGVGPMTIAMLMDNTLLSFEQTL